MMQLSDLNAWINTQQPAFLKALAEFVNLNTFSDNHVGVDAGMDKLSLLAAEMGFGVEVVRGRHRLIKAGNGTGAPLLLVAHMDTVHPPDGDFQQYEPQEGGYIRGPGIGDIKGGLLMGLWALMGLQNLRADFNVQLIVSADEEKGSPTLNDWYIENPIGARYALGLEPGFPQTPLGAGVLMGVVEQRKGCGRVSFGLKGVASHAGGNFREGLSAIEALASRILKIQALSDLERGITTNVGLISGGTAANTVAEYASAGVDFRFLTQADGEATLAAIREIVHQPTLHNDYLDKWDEVTAFDLEVFMPPMEASAENRQLIDLVLREAERLALPMKAITRGGGSDANYTSRAGVPSICGMGAPAEGIHTTRERIYEPLLWPRLELLIATLYHLSDAVG